MDDKLKEMINSIESAKSRNDLMNLIINDYKLYMHYDLSNKVLDALPTKLKNSVKNIIKKDTPYPYNLFIELTGDSSNIESYIIDEEVFDSLIMTIDDVRAIDMMFLYFKDYMNFTQIADKYGMSVTRVAQIIYKQLRRLRHPLKIKIIKKKIHLDYTVLRPNTSNFLLSNGITSTNMLDGKMSDLDISFISSIPLEIFIDLRVNKLTKRTIITSLEQSRYLLEALTDIDMCEKPKELSLIDFQCLMEYIQGDIKAKRYASFINKLICIYGSDLVNKTISSIEESINQREKQLCHKKKISIISRKTTFTQTYKEYIDIFTQGFNELENHYFNNLDSMTYLELNRIQKEMIDILQFMEFGIDRLKKSIINIHDNK